MKRITLLSVVCALLLATTLAADAISRLRQVTCGGMTDQVVVRAELDLRGDLGGRVVRLSSKDGFLLVTLPRTIVEPARRTFEANHPAVRSILAAQRDPEHVNLRIELAPGAVVDPASIRHEVVGNELRLFFSVTGSFQQPKPAAPAAPVAGGEEKAAAPAQQPGAEVLPPGALKSEAWTRIDQRLAELAAKQPAREARVDSGATEKGEAAAAPIVREEGLAESRSEEETPAGDAVTDEQQPDPLAALFRDEAKADKAAPEGPSLAWMAIKLVAAVSLVAGCLIVGLNLLRKMKWSARALGLDNESIRVLATQSLGLKRSLVLVEICGERMALAVTGNDVRFLARLGQSGSPPAEQPSAPADFGEELRRIQARDTAREERPSPVGPEPIPYENAVASIRKKIASLKRL